MRIYGYSPDLRECEMIDEIKEKALLTHYRNLISKLGKNAVIVITEDQRCFSNGENLHIKDKIRP